MKKIKEEEGEEGEDGEDGEKKEDDTQSEDDEEKDDKKQSENVEPPRVLISKISPPLYINSRKLAKESSTKKYHTVIEPFDIQAVE